MAIDVWGDNWLSSGEALIRPDNAPPLKVHDLISPYGGGWNCALIQSLFQPDLALKIFQTPVSKLQQADYLFWPHTPEGNYFVSSGFRIARENFPIIQPSEARSHNIPKELWNTIWGSLVPQKIKNFLWRACHNSIAVKYNLWRKRISPSGRCPLCNADQETVEHMLLVCPWTRAVWFGSSLQWAIPLYGLASLDIWLLQKISTLQLLSVDFSRDFSVLACTLWSI